MSPGNWEVLLENHKMLALHIISADSNFSANACFSLNMTSLVSVPTSLHVSSSRIMGSKSQRSFHSRDFNVSSSDCEGGRPSQDAWAIELCF